MSLRLSSLVLCPSSFENRAKHRAPGKGQVVRTNPLNILNDTRTVALVGHPNVGKSVVFARLTSRYAAVSNYPGTTVDIFRSRAVVNGRDYEIIDTPGINTLTAGSEDERATLGLLQREHPDLIVQVADGKNLRRALLLTAQLARLERPLVLALNMTDECQLRGISVDPQALSQKLGVPVVQTVATTGAGFEQLRQSLASTALCVPTGSDPAQWVNTVIDQVHSQATISRPGAGLQTRFFAMACLLGLVVHLHNYIDAWGWPTFYSLLQQGLKARGIEGLFSDLVVTVVAFLLPVLTPFLWAVRVDPAFREHFGTWARKRAAGTLILVGTLSLVYQLVGNLGAQVFVEILEETLFGRWFLPAVNGVLPSGFFHDLLVGQYGLISMGLTYGIAIVLPVVSTFFIAFSFLEDSGYLPRLSILSNNLFRAVGLNGKAFLPMVLGLGCVTMATMSTRILNSRKERIIAATLLALGVPCSAQLGVILGIVSGISAPAGAIVFTTVLLQVVVVGFILSRVLPGRRSEFILEIPPIRFPLWSNIFRKTATRVMWFLKEALPLFLLGTLLLFLLDQVGLIQSMVRALEPVTVSLLGLPSRTATVFLLGFLRRDYGAAGLFDMARAGQLDTIQIVVSLTVMTLFVPCIANFFVLIKEHGLKVALSMAGLITLYSILVGAVLNLLLRGMGASL